MTKHPVRCFHRIVLSILVVLTVVSCDKQYSETTLKRPAAVPANALWVGSDDGGVYVLITKPVNSEQYVYDGTIYYDNGEQWYKGKMELFPKGASFANIDNKNSYSGWDGDTLYLSNGRLLKAIEK